LLLEVFVLGVPGKLLLARLKGRLMLPSGQSLSRLPVTALESFSRGKLLTAKTLTSLELLTANPFIRKEAALKSRLARSKALATDTLFPGEVTPCLDLSLPLSLTSLSSVNRLHCPLKALGALVLGLLLKLDANATRATALSSEPPIDSVLGLLASCLLTLRRLLACHIVLTDTAVHSACHYLAPFKL
jgi:hypothetical protein